MRARLSIRVAVLAVTAAMLAACGSDDDGDGSGNGGSATGDAGEPRSGGSLSVLQAAEPRTLDPGAMQNSISQHSFVGEALYGHLLLLDENGEIEYGLAEDLTGSDDGTSWTLTLRDDVTFSDGTPFDAEAVAFNWERLKDPAIGGISASYAAYVDTLSPSGQVLEITLTRPIGQLADVIADRSLNWIASPEALQRGAAEFDANPIGAGPFVLESWQRQGQMVLARNENYYDPERPYLDELVLTANPDAGQRFAALESGQVDAVTSSNPDLLAVAVDGGAQATYQDLAGGISIDMNTLQAPFDDVRARQAINLAVDFDAVNAVAYDGAGEVPDAVFTDDELNGDARFPEHDPEAAQELFDELAAEGRPVEFTISSFQVTQVRRVSEALQAQLNQYDNVSVELEVLDNAAGVAKFTGREFQMMSSQLQGRAVTLYGQLYGGQTGNYTGISDPELDAALETAVTTTDADERAEAYRTINARYIELVPSRPYIRPQIALVHDDRLQGVEMFATGAMRVDKLWVTE